MRHSLEREEYKTVPSLCFSFLSIFFSFNQISLNQISRKVQSELRQTHRINHFKGSLSDQPTNTINMTCCGRNNGAECVCAKEATCSCGKQPALQCNCNKAADENKLPGNTCVCGKRAEGSCTCGRTDSNNGSSALETDFTTQK